MKENDLKVSIITVVRNGAKTIEQTILSVLEQTYKNIEYIIIDGESTDGTLQIVENYFRFIDCFVSEADQGIYDAMNKGIQKATGDIIGIINSDDWYAKDAVKNVVDYLCQKDVDVVYGKIDYVFENGSRKEWKRAALETFWYRNVVKHPSVFIKKEIYMKYGGFNLKYAVCGDYELLLRLYSKHIRFGFTDNVIAYFRVGGFSSKFQYKSIVERKEISMNYIEYSPNKSETLNKIEDEYRWGKFSLEIRNRKNLLSDLLSTYFQKKVSEIIIFGTGILSEECYRILQEEKIVVKFFSDNDPNKWNNEIHGIRVAMPQEIYDKGGYVLIAVRDDAEKIKEQLKKNKSTELKCVYLKELVDDLAERNFWYKEV